MDRNASCQVRSGQVRVFNVHIQSKLLQRTPVTGTGTGEGVKGGGGGDRLHWRGTSKYKQSDRNRLQAECVLRCYGIWNVP